MSDDGRRVSTSNREWTLRKGYWENDSERSAAEEEREEEEEEEVIDSCELAPHSAMSVGAGRVDSPSPQDIRLLHDLVEDLSKEQDEKNKPRAEQVSHALLKVERGDWCVGGGQPHPQRLLSESDKLPEALRVARRETARRVRLSLHIRLASIIAMHARNFLPGSNNNPRAITM